MALVMLEVEKLNMLPLNSCVLGGCNPDDALATKITNHPHAEVSS